MAAVIPVFRKGAWIKYTTPTPVDSMWSPKHTLRAASFYATAVSQGLDTKEAALLAECFINKEVYEGLVYDTIYETKLKRIMDHAETA